MQIHPYIDGVYALIEFYAWQNFNEVMHAQTYSMIIDEYFDDLEEKKEVFNAVKRMPVIAEKTNWALQFSDPATADFAERLIGFICVEGVMFAGSFAAIFYFRSKNVLKGLLQANTFICADETLHVRFAIEVYKLVKRRLSQEHVHRIFKSAVDTEIRFLTEALPVSLIGLNDEDMAEYIRYVADFWLVQMGYEKLYYAEQPLAYMDRISLRGKDNFFEMRSTVYQACVVIDRVSS